MQYDLMAGAMVGPVMALRRVPTILVFDSGLGGLTVYTEIVKARPDARFVYVADDAGFPYGRLSETALVDRVVRVMERLIALHAPDLVVIACNTASTLVMPHLRRRFPIPFVGTVPAIKPAAMLTTSRRISVLATPGTVARDYTRNLISAYALGCDVELIGSTQLAGMAEAEMRGRPVEDADILAELAPCFIDNDHRRTDVVVLACTHYPLLAARFETLAPWPVHWIDPAPAVARRVVQLIGGPEATDMSDASTIAVFTHGVALETELTLALEPRGLRDVRVEAMPLSE